MAMAQKRKLFCRGRMGMNNSDRETFPMQTKSHDSPTARQHTKPIDRVRAAIESLGGQEIQNIEGAPDEVVVKLTIGGTSRLFAFPGRGKV